MSFGAGLSVQEVVPPAEAGGVVTNELLVVHVVVIGSGPDGEEVTQAPGEVVAAVGIDSLPEAEDNPDVHGNEVKLASHEKNNDGRSNDTHTEKHGLNRRGVLSSKTERSGVGVVHLVNRLVQGAVVQATVEPVVPSVLEDEADGDLESHLSQGRERNAILQAKVRGDGVEEPNLRQLSSEVTDEDEGGAVPLLLEGGHLLALNLVLAEIGNLVHNDERNASAEVNNLVEDEAHDTSGEGVVLHKQVPGRPEALDVVELDILLADFLEDGEVVLCLVGSKCRKRGRVPVTRKNNGQNWRRQG